MSSYTDYLARLNDQIDTLNRRIAVLSDVLVWENDTDLVDQIKKSIHELTTELNTAQSELYVAKAWAEYDVEI